ncbi:MAG TPA: hypothetical protein VM261_39005 [Kofleriaceae bacterium]|nr:hypothetical protein [Kofleriaceae bacterium]
MARLLLGSLLSLSLLTSGCTAAYADRVAPPRPLVPIAVAPDAIRSPYSVEIISGDGDTLDTYFQKGRYYVHGANGERYTVRVTNPTDQRIEVVVSVDGLDVIDGETGDLRKRGYVVQPHGTVLVEGWRTSLSDVASFRFSSVKGSYAGKKSKARNVGVVAVAIFAEQAAPQIIIDEPDDPDYYYEEDDGDGYYGDKVEGYLDRGQSRAPARSGGSGGGGGRVAAKRPAPPPPPSGGGGGSVGADSAGEAEAPSTSVSGGAVAPRPPSDVRRDESCCSDKPAERERLGLGTEFGESRYSAASYTRFVRASDRPVAVAELRYNDTAGLKALGILVEPEPDSDEIMTRETADPFPGDRGFARPPAGIR